jgi:hypothetical protein
MNFLSIRCLVGAFTPFMFMVAILKHAILSYLRGVWVSWRLTGWGVKNRRCGVGLCKLIFYLLTVAVMSGFCFFSAQFSGHVRVLILSFCYLTLDFLAFLSLTVHQFLIFVGMFETLPVRSRRRCSRHGQ